MWSDRRLIVFGLLGAVVCGVLLFSPLLPAWIVAANLHPSLLVALETLLFGLLGVSIIFLLTGLKRHLRPQ